ncbi:MAG: hypothetical protein ACT4NY_09065 [Pseudonocardiales bacterium]
MATPLVDTAVLAAFTRRDPADPLLVFAVTMATDVIQGECGGRVTSPPQAGITAVALGVAARMVNGPAGVSSESDGSVSFGYSSVTGTAELTKGERAQLRRLLGVGAVYSLPIVVGGAE